MQPDQERSPDPIVLTDITAVGAVGEDLTSTSSCSRGLALR